MTVRVLLLFLLSLPLLFGQTKMTVEQLRSFIRSSSQLGHPDNKVADFLKHVKLAHRLDARTVEELQGLGAGPKTVAALRVLSEGSKSLPPPPAPPPKPIVQSIPPPSPEEQKQILDSVREYALAYTKNLPNFICTQVTRRYVDPSGLEFWQRQDVVTAKLSYFEQKEDYKVVLVNNQIVDTTFDKIGGATSQGEFGSMLREIFAPATETKFEWERWATLRGDRMHVYSYFVSQPKSQWRIFYENTDSVRPAYQGLVYVDKNTQAVMRVTMQAVDLPPAFPVQQAATTLDYDFVKIAENDYVVPLKAVVRMRSGKVLTKNEVEFRMYKRFGAEATITFTPDPLPEDQTTEEPQQD
ncbi:MAG: hypothetical protein ACRD7E_04300 [Bryobacteraceae bacterium]